MLRGVTGPLLAGLSVGLFLLSTLAAEPGMDREAELQEDPAAGALYLTAIRTNEPFLEPLHLFNPHYALTTAAPGADESRKAYMGLSSGADTHTPALFHYTMEDELHLLGTAEVFLYVSCDLVSVAPQSIWDPIRISLVQNGEPFAVGTGGNSPTVCAPGDVLEVIVNVTDAQASFEPGDQFRLEIGTGGFINPGDPVENLHVLTGSTLHPSRIEAPGLPGPVG